MTIHFLIFFVILWEFTCFAPFGGFIKQYLFHIAMRSNACCRSLGSLAVIGILFASCSGKKQNMVESLPDDFNQLSDTAKVAHMMDIVSPDSVARFICDAALGKSNVAKIDTFAIATAYAYQHYVDSCLISFSQELDDYSANLPLVDKMEIYKQAGQSDPQRLGYELGLDYVNYIRNNHKNAAKVKEEIDAFRVACADDSLMYIRFIKGFKTVLQADRGKDLPEEIYTMFINY